MLRIGSIGIILILAVSLSCVSAYQPAKAPLSMGPMAVPQHTFTLTEWNVPTVGGGPWWITVDQTGKLWFTENVTSKIGMFDPSTNNITEWAIPGGGNPRYVTTKQVTVSGSNYTRVYFTLNSSSRIAYFDSWNGTFHEWPLPAGSNPVGLFVDANNTIWFTESGRDIIGKLVPYKNQLTEWTLQGATGTAGSPLLQPWGIYAQPTLTGPFSNITDRRVWFTELKANTIGQLLASTGQFTLWNLNSLNIIPGLQYAPMDLTVDPAGNVIFTGSAADRISVLTNGGGGIYREYTIPTHASTSKPTSLSLDSKRGVSWFTEYRTGILANANTTSVSQSSIPPAPTTFTVTPTTTTLTPTITSGVVGASVTQTPQTSTVTSGQTTASITEYPLPNSTSRPNSVTVDPAGNVWFTESNPAVNKIGRLSIPFVFQIAAIPSTQSTVKGGSATYTVQVSLVSGSPQPVQLSLLNVPLNVTGSFGIPIGMPSFTSPLTLTTTSSITPTTYSVTVLALSGTQKQNTTVTLTVQGPAPPPGFDYRIDVEGASTLTVQQGQVGTFTLQVSLTSGTTQPVNVSVSGLPPQSTYSLSQNLAQPTFSTTLSIQTSFSTPAGSYPITVTAISDGGSPHSPSQLPLLLVTELPRDFSLITVGSVNLVQGTKVYVPVTVSASGYFQNNVTLSGTFAPASTGLTVSFTPSVVLPPLNGTAQSVMEITAFQNTAGQPYQLTITGVSATPSRTHQITLNVNVSPCLIATASFGSSTAPEVQLLRGFRDNQIMHSFAGSTFMMLFNSWYYSFSPSVARFEYSHSTARTAMRILLYPLIAILQLGSWSYSTMSFVPEFAALTIGMLVGFLIGLTYCSIPSYGIARVIRRKGGGGVIRDMKWWLTASLLVGIVLYSLSELLALRWGMSIAAADIVLSALGWGAMCPSLFELRRRNRVNLSCATQRI